MAGWLTPCRYGCLFGPVPVSRCTNVVTSFDYILYIIGCKEKSKGSGGPGAENRLLTRFGDFMDAARFFSIKTLDSRKMIGK